MPVFQRRQHPLKQQAAAQHRRRTVTQRIRIEHPEPDYPRRRRKLLPGEVNMLRWLGRGVDIPEVRFDARTRVHLTRSDVEPGKEPLDDPGRGITLAKRRIALLRSTFERCAAVPTRL